ncbi:MAG TPA: small ribosomal subunit Rsm22 family protein [Nitrospiraceae bacterium]|jgi:ribosomal protein RSM22 (predicted rRNA methylase)
MRAFQGKQPVRLSPLLSRILDGIEPKRPDIETARAVAELSRLFTRERDALGKDYLNDPALAAAYRTYFFPVNLSKIQVLLEELPEDWQRPEDGTLRVLDLGTGPGTGALAVLDWLKQHDPDSLKELTVVAVDDSTEALSEARRLWTDYSIKSGLSDASLLLYEGDLARPADHGWRDHVARGGPYDLIILANCLNELFGEAADPISRRFELMKTLLAFLTPHGTIMIVEPALRQVSRELHRVRDRMLEHKLCTVYSPCLHEQPCPALVHPDDWCHEERPWEPPASIQQIDEKVGFIKDALKFSYLLLRKDGKTIVERRPDVYRVVSELREMKGEKRAWLCNEQGRQEAGRQDRLVSSENAALDQWHRGAIVQIERIVRKERGGKVSPLGRIEQDSAVQIVRSV